MQATLQAPAPPRFLDTAAVSVLTGIAEQTLCNWRSTRREGPPWTKLGRRVVYDRRALEAWLQEQTIDPRG